jgi:hypothetical protein
MKVFRVGAERKRYQMIGAVPGFVEKFPPTTAQARHLRSWEPMTMPVEDPTKLRGDFLFFRSSTWSARARAIRDFTGAFCSAVR